MSLLFVLVLKYLLLIIRLTLSIVYVPYNQPHKLTTIGSPSILYLPHSFNRSEPITVTHMYRGPSASRHIVNIELIQGMLREAFPAPRLGYTVVDSV